MKCIASLLAEIDPGPDPSIHSFPLLKQANATCLGIDASLRIGDVIGVQCSMYTYRHHSTVDWMVSMRSEGYAI